MGARRGYAVPAILHEAGMLERFYTDVCGSVGLGRAASALQYLPAVGDRLRKLHNRHLPDSIVAKTHTFGRAVLAHALRSAGANGDAGRRFLQNQRFQQALGRAMIRAGFGDATHVFSMLGEGGPFLAEAKRRGLAVVSEVYILLSTERIVAEERKAFPDWEPDAPDYAALRRALGGDDVLLKHSDWFVCPSPAVRDDLVAHWGVEAVQTCVVPYGMDPGWLDLEPRPIPRRVLFVGTADLRKGIHYLAMAAERLAAQGYELEFRVAGHVTPHIAGRPDCRRLNFLGRVPRDRIRDEFQTADVFVLPSLAEGSAEVCYEALAAGVPVITTPAAGSVVRDGVDGRHVPERDAAALAEAIAATVSNRGLRNQLAANARQRAADFTWPRYGERLIEALRSINESVTASACPA